MHHRPLKKRDLNEARHEYRGYTRGSKAKRVFPSTFSLSACLGFPRGECTAGIMLIFGVRRLLSLKNCEMRPQNSFLRFSLKIQLFFEKLLNKKIFSIKFRMKKATFIFGVRLSRQVAWLHSFLV